MGSGSAWAGTNALRDRYGEGCYGTRAAHAARWRLFAEFAQHHAVKDARDVTGELVERFGRCVIDQRRRGRALRPLRPESPLHRERRAGDDARGPVACASRPRRSSVSAATFGATAPVITRSVQSRRAIARAIAEGEERTALVAALARELGAPLSRSVAARQPTALKEAQERGAANITAGTKGGRGKKVDRWVPVSERRSRTLQRAARLTGSPPPISSRRIRTTGNGASTPITSGSVSRRRRDPRVS